MTCFHLQKQKQNVLQINNSKLFLAVFSAVLGNFSFGYSLVFSSPVIPQLKSPDADLRLRMNTSQAAWFGSIYTLGAALGGLGAMFLNDKIGRKLSIMVSAVPSSIGLVLTQKKPGMHFTQSKTQRVSVWVNGVYVLWWTCGVSGVKPEELGVKKKKQQRQHWKMDGQDIFQPIILMF